jgi:hypothetical protein
LGIFVPSFFLTEVLLLADGAAGVLREELDGVDEAALDG